MTENKSNVTSAPAPRTYRRKAKNILIHKPMQREFSMVLIGLLMVSTFAVAFIINNTLREMTMGGGYHFGKVSPYELLSDIGYQLVVRVSSILLATLIVLAFYGVFFLHRVAGPVYRFRQTFLRLNDGEIPNLIKLREGDFFGETAAEINRLIKRLQFEKERSKQICEKLKAPSGGLTPAALQEIKTLAENQYREG